MPNVTFIVETFLGYDRPDQFVTPEWVDFRLRWFHQYTLQSLLGQAFKDFRIFVQCGERHRARLEAYPWDPAVTVCFNRGHDEYAKIDTDYLSITRIDSDDLFHHGNMAEVRDNLILASARRVLCWKTRIVWDYVNGYLTSDHRRASSPFFTHIFPRSIYQNWPAFQAQHFLPHGVGGAGDLGAKALSRKRVCVVKHGWNHSVLKRGERWAIITTPVQMAAHVKNLRKKNPDLKFYFDRDTIIRALEPFSVTPGMIP